MTIFSRSSSKNFLAVAITVILIGAVLLAVGVIQYVLSFFTNQTFGWPALKIIAGVVVISLGYIQLQLELIRVKSNQD